MKKVTSEGCYTHTPHHSVEGVSPKIIMYNCSPHYDATKKNGTEQIFA